MSICIYEKVPRFTEELALILWASSLDPELYYSEISSANLNNANIEYSSRLNHVRYEKLKIQVIQN